MPLTVIAGSSAYPLGGALAAGGAIAGALEAGGATATPFELDARFAGGASTVGAFTVATGAAAAGGGAGTAYVGAGARAGDCDS